MIITNELILSCMILVLVLLVLLVLYCILRRSGSRKFTVLRISTGQNACVLTVRTESEQAQQMLDHLLDRVILLVESGEKREQKRVAEPIVELNEQRVAEPVAERVPEPRKERGSGRRREEVEGVSDSGSNMEAYTEASLSSQAINKLWGWISSSPATKKKKGRRRHSSSSSAGSSSS